MSPDVSEADFQRAVIDLAKLRGWRVYFTHRSDRSPAGYPDLTMVRSGRLVIAELKSAKGRIRPEQREWLDELAVVQQLSLNAVRRYLWRPADWPAIQAVLR